MDSLLVRIQTNLSIGPIPLAVLLSLAACVAQVPKTDSAPPPTSAEAEQMRLDKESYRILQASLREGAVVSDIPGSAMYPSTSGRSLFWLNFANFDPSLSRLTPQANGRLDYQFSVGSGDAFNYRASDDLVVTANARSGEFHVYAANEPSVEIATAQPPEPASGQKWWSYAVYEKSIYFLTEGDAGVDVWSWQPPALPRLAHSIAGGQGRFGEILDIGVDDTSLYVFAATGLWRLSLSDFSAERLKVDARHVERVSIDHGEALFELGNPNGTSLRFLKPGAPDDVNLSTLITASAYRLSSSYPMAHFPDEGGFTRWGDWLVYSAGLGIFAYQLETGEIRPILLEALSDDAEFTLRDPVALSSGKLFVWANSVDETRSPTQDVLVVDLAEILD